MAKATVAGSLLDSILTMGETERKAVVPAFATTHKISVGDFYKLLSEREDEQRLSKLDEKLTTEMTEGVSGLLPDWAAEELTDDATRRVVVTFKYDPKGGEDKKGAMTFAVNFQTARGRKAKAADAE